MRIEITEDDAGRRLDAVVRRRASLPRPLVMKLIRTGKVRVNERKAALDARVETGDVVLVDAVPGEARAPPAQRAGALPHFPAEEAARRVLLEDDDLLVFDKPPGIVAHAGSGHEAGLVDVLAAFLEGRDGPRAFKPALAQRLDRDTSGASLLAKTGLALRGLTAAIRVGRLEKCYHALVRGVPSPAEGVVDAALRKDAQPDGKERMCVVAADAPGALAARTRWRTLEVLPGARAALLELVPETGRTHQLRVHCAHMGHPIAGDPRYGDRSFDALVQVEGGLDRLFLHAARIAFPHPRTGARVEVAAPLAADLARALGRLRAAR